MVKALCVLGCTGSIGTQALDVCRRLNINVAGLVAGRNAALLYEQVKAFKPLKSALGIDGAIGLAAMDGCDTVLNAIGGSAGIRASFAALSAGKRLLLANKETIVAAGDLIQNVLTKTKSDEIIPVDSEHSAVFQCLGGSLNAKGAGVRRIILTASGGAFRGLRKEALTAVTAKAALNHPTWRMGKKVTIDSATLMNKGFEVLEAASLFNMPIDNIEVVVHPQSIIHSMVEFEDGAVLAQLAVPDMRLPIQYAITYPTRTESGMGRVNFTKTPLTFEPVNDALFPCLRLAIEAGKRGGGYGAVLVGADEAAVEFFEKGIIGYFDIAAVIDSALQAYNNDDASDLEGRIRAALWGYNHVKECLL